MSTYVDMLKEFYTQKKVEKLVFEGSPLFAMLPKKTDIEGETWDVPLVYGDPPAASATFAVAQGNKGPGSYEKFQVTTRDEYSFASISRKLMKASKSNKGAFLPGSKAQIEGAFRACRRSIAIQLYNDGSGALGQIATGGISGAVITLTSRHDAVKFQPKMKLQHATTRTGGAVESSDAQATVLAVNKRAGTITLTADVTTAWTDAVVGDYIYRAGDYDAALQGLLAWIPSSDPASTAFHGVDRTVDPVALAGVRCDGTGMSVKEALINLQSEVATIGDGKPDHCFIHPSQFRALEKELDDAVVIDVKVGKAEIGFTGIALRGDAGVMRIFPDRFCSPELAYALQLDSWEVGSMGPFPEIFDEDLEMLREGSSDGYELRIGGYGNLACHAPGFNGVSTLDAQA